MSESEGHGTANPVEAAWQEYRQGLGSFIRSRVKTIDDAEDILGDVFEKLVVQSSQKQLPENIVGWLYQVTRNRIVDYYRSKKVFEELPQDLSDDVPAPNVTEQLSHCLLPMINALPQEYREILIAVEIEGKKQRVVAEESGLSLSAVKSRVLRGRDMLARSMARCCLIYNDKQGRVMDFEQKSLDICGDCAEK